jgi:hypothetical protein
MLAATTLVTFRQLPDRSPLLFSSGTREPGSALAMTAF